ncbi:MAG: decaprenyl-phosphate phosphoribosyltransferase [Candidatus Dormibacteria bacterium]
MAVEASSLQPEPADGAARQRAQPGALRINDLAAPRASTARLLLRSARPRQWVKNGFVLVPGFFGAAVGLRALVSVLVMAGAFCLVASSLYLVNDVVDRTADRAHQRKRLRPIASGQLDVRTALIAAVAGTTVGLLGAVATAPAAGGLLGLYALLSLAYTVRLKHIVIIDVMAIAAGFVLRVESGALAARVPASEWLLLCMLFLALFLGFGKRYHEIVLLGDEADEHRRVLGDYTPAALSQFLSASMLGTLLSYALYTFFSENASHHHALVITVPFACYGVFRYMLLVGTRSQGGAPEELLLTDRPLLVTTLLWVMTAAGVLYAPALS